MRAGRRAAWRWGLTAETLCVLSLRLRGWSIVARRLTAGRGTGAGEIDIIAKRGRLLAFIEVKARPRLADAAFAISRAQRRRLSRAAEAFLAGRPDLAHCTTRFDAMLVTGWRWPKHLADAWRVDD